jgi:hypothetical protein
VGKPTLWSKEEGRWKFVVRTEEADFDPRGSRDGMLMKIGRAGREIHCDGGEATNFDV